MLTRRQPGPRWRRASRGAPTAPRPTWELTWEREWLAWLCGDEVRTERCAEPGLPPRWGPRARGQHRVGGRHAELVRPVLAGVPGGAVGAAAVDRPRQGAPAGQRGDRGGPPA